MWNQFYGQNNNTYWPQVNNEVFSAFCKTLPNKLKILKGENM